LRRKTLCRIGGGAQRKTWWGKDLLAKFKVGFRKDAKRTLLSKKINPRKRGPLLFRGGDFYEKSVLAGMGRGPLKGVIERETPSSKGPC